MPRSQTPLTDPRSLASSAAFHAGLLLLASVAALGVALPRASAPPPKVLQAVLGPVDTRAPAEAGGGGAGAIGGMGDLAAVTVSPSSSALPSAADALLAEALPASSTAVTNPQALPGPGTSGLGVMPGPGAGGGGGVGGGSGGGKGKGVGPGTEFFGARDQAGSFAYVIDRSGSMTNRNSLGVAKRELTASLGQLPPDAKVGVIVYNMNASTFADAKGVEGLMPATAENKARIQARLKTVDPEGGTDHKVALQTALAMRPEVVFFLTDGDLMSTADVEDIRAVAGSTRIQVVEFGIGPDPGSVTPLRTLAATTGGAYRYIDVISFR